MPSTQARTAPVAEIGCAPLSGAALAEDDSERLAAALKAIADPARLRILSLLQAQDHAEACVCHLTGPLGLSQPTVSHHIKVLADAGLVVGERRGSWTHYRVERERLAGIADLLR